MRPDPESPRRDGERTGSPDRAHEPRAAGFRSGLDLPVLGIALAALAPMLIPSHWTSLWMDREFTGTVAPIANRLGPGVKLYADGGHIPMPPLPFVLMRLITGGHATWLWESALNFGFQSLTLLLSYVALRRLVRPAAAFLAAFVSLPVFFALPKTVLYDSMAQASVAALMLQAVAFFSRPEPGGRRVAGRHPLASRLLPLAGLALTSAVALLVKQSTGIGACLGLACALVLCGRGDTRDRLRRAAGYALLSLTCLAALIVALHPWVDVPGLMRDVFITGAEPKGGPTRMLGDLRRSAVEIGRYALLLLVPIALLIVAARRIARAPSGARHLAPGRGPTPTPGFIAIGALLSAPVMLAIVVAGPWTPTAVLAHTRALALILWAGLFFAAMLSLRCRGLDLLRGVARARRPRAFAGAFAIAGAAAVFHSLSAHTFRWSYDNNPLVLVAYAALFQVALASLGRLSSRRLRLVAVVLVCFVVTPLRAWARLGDQLLACRACTERWGEVSYLAGARMPASAAGMRQLVGEVRRSAAPGQQVLLLPNDPDVEAWFERDRPRLSSLFVFADQYWDRYVDADLARLEARPPQVIVIGPIGYWRTFHRMHQYGRGAERLVDRVTNELLPACYELSATIPILYQGGPDSMEVYVRRP